MTQNHLSERAKHRLRLAAALLREQGFAFPCSRQDFYNKIQDAISGLTEDKRSLLKGLVDWVEAYDRADTVSHQETTKQ